MNFDWLHDCAGCHQLDADDIPQAPRFEYSSKLKDISGITIGGLCNHRLAHTAGCMINVKELEMWVTNRLKELFPYVAKPYTLYNNGRPLFTFYFAVSNQKKAAWRLADRAVRYILKN